MNNWEAFLEKLDLEKEFDRELKEYLCAIKAVSEIKVENIDIPKTREQINEQLKKIVDFIKKYAEDYYEIGLIKGFKANEEVNGNWKIDGRDYYYYIADQKMKASVYYVRYMNYINRYLRKAEGAESELDAYKEIIQTQLKKDVQISKDNIISVIDDVLEQTDENQELRKKCIECVEQIRTNNINYLKYMLFNNMMREIRYIGAAYQYLWHWETKTKNLFRYVSYDGAEIPIEENCSKKSFLIKMFNDVISHMNNSSEKLCSYSKDPYVDVFKYLKIQKKSNKEFVDIDSSNSNIKIKIENLENENKARFHVVKGVTVNSIYRDGIAESFYDFVQDGKALSSDEALAYAVELYPDLPETETNSKDTPKNIKKLLLAYLGTWSEGEDVNQLMSYVADDKEVVTYGKIEKDVVNINSIEPSDLRDGTRYEMELDKNELIYLLLKLKNVDVDEITKQYKVSLNMYGKDVWIRQAIKGETEAVNVIDGKISIQITDTERITIDTESVLQPSVIEDGEKYTVEEIKKKINEEVEIQIQNYFRNRYSAILSERHYVGDFILNFIAQEGYKCPSYIDKYNEYQPKNGDEEISMLKYLIFKRW